MFDGIFSAFKGRGKVNQPQPKNEKKLPQDKEQNKKNELGFTTKEMTDPTITELTTWWGERLEKTSVNKLGMSDMEMDKEVIPKLIEIWINKLKSRRDDISQTTINKLKWDFTPLLKMSGEINPSMPLANLWKTVDKILNTYWEDRNMEGFNKQSLETELGEFRIKHAEDKKGKDPEINDERMAA